MAKLTVKQKKFADEYIISGNATQSYIDAGYSAKKRNTAEANARRLLGNDSVKTYIKERMKALDEQAIASQKEVMKFLTSVLRGEQTEEKVVAGCDKPIQVKVSIGDQIKAGELIGKRFGMWTDKQEVSVQGAVVFEDDVD
ncbi:terminase [Aerococcus christensenii]|uniref:Terminase n=1 Tax=Aerococcus christensenii TaxID=87541 RepID=A0A2I1K7C7_9LACT|nr:terminase small subunit [Aerococcus christensenii]PKY91539.1 terminase [Aerococcus christensenii]